MTSTNGYYNEVDGAYTGLILRSSNYERWKEKQEADFEAALEALINKTTPKDAVYQRPGRGGMTFDYVTGWWMIEQLNALFNRQWSWRIDREEVGQHQVWVRGVLTVRMGPGPEGLVSKEAYGGADIKQASGGGKVIDIADDLKSASTDALKKAGSMLGIAADIYGKHGDHGTAPEVGFDSSRFKVLLMRAKNLSMDEEALKDWIVAQTDINPKGSSMEDLTEKMMDQVLQRIVKMDTDRQKAEKNA